MSDQDKDSTIPSVGHQESDRWIDASAQLPDDDRAVLVHVVDVSDPVWLGYWDGESWRTVEGMRVEVRHWREIPLPPGYPSGK